MSLSDPLDRVRDDETAGSVQRDAVLQSENIVGRAETSDSVFIREYTDVPERLFPHGGIGHTAFQILLECFFEKICFSGEILRCPQKKSGVSGFASEPEFLNDTGDIPVWRWLPRRNGVHCLSHRRQGARHGVGAAGQGPCGFSYTYRRQQAHLSGHSHRSSRQGWNQLPRSDGSASADTDDHCEGLYSATDLAIFFIFYLLLTDI